MDQHPERIVFEGRTYRLSGNYYRRHEWGREGPSNLHRAIWESVNGSIPCGFEVHHKDGNPFNNDISNLECLNGSKHQRNHALQRLAEGSLKPPGELARLLAAEWHASPEGLDWHSEHARKTWENREWSEVRCKNCDRPFRTPYPTRAKWCHLNCKMEALRKRRGATVGTKPNRRRTHTLSGKRAPVLQ